MKEMLKLTLADGKSIHILVGDITEQQVDAVVNAANSSLMGGGGVDGAIHRAGGPAILEECKKVVARQGHLLPGDAVATTAGRMKAGYVIHTVGPIWQGGNHGEAKVLERCYSNSLSVADGMRLQSVAFPAISTGAYGYPAEAASQIALRTTLNSLHGAKHIHEVRFVLFDSRIFDIYSCLATDTARDIHSYRLDKLTGMLLQ